MCFLLGQHIPLLSSRAEWYNIIFSSDKGIPGQEEGAHLMVALYLHFPRMLNFLSLILLNFFLLPSQSLINLRPCQGHWPMSTSMLLSRFTNVLTETVTGSFLDKYATTREQSQ